MSLSTVRHSQRPTWGDIQKQASKRLACFCFFSLPCSFYGVSLNSSGLPRFLSCRLYIFSTILLLRGCVDNMAVATSKSRPLTWLQDQGGAAWLPSCHCRPGFFNSGLSMRINQRLRPWACPRLKMVGKRNLTSNSVAKGLEGEVKSHGADEDQYYISEEDKRFVEALQEAQPYVYLHRGSTFVVVIAGELLATPSLDTLVKVLSLSLSFSLSEVLYRAVRSFFFFCTNKSKSGKS
jgi:hypothetical protein